MSFNLGSAHGEIVIDYNGAGVQQAMGDLSSLQQTGTNLMRAGAGVAGFGAAIGGALLGATNQAADFQFQMDAVNAALGGLDASQMEVVTQQALDMGAASKFSAGEVAGVQEQLAKSGLSVEQITGGATQAVLDMAAATGEALVPSAAAAAAAVNLFGLDAAQTADVADIFTAGLNASSASLSDFQRGINNLGPVMANLNQYANDGEGAFRDTAAAVAYFNANGLKAADAGVSLARALTNLATPTSKAAKLMTELGIESFDAQGNFIGFPALMDELNQSMSGMSDEAREAALATIFGAEAADVMNQAVKKGGDGLREYTKQVTANGQAAEQARIRQDNLRGALEQLTGAISTAAINIGSTFLGPLQSIVEGITSLINAFNSLPPEIQATIAQFAALAAAMSLLGGGALIAAGAILRFGPMFAAAAAAAAPFLAILLAIGAAIGLGILAYKTDFLGFGKAVDKTLANAQKAIKTFGKTFEEAFADDKAAGLNDIAAGIAAFGTALEAATGIDLTDQFRAASGAVQAFGDAWATAQNFGFNPAASALLSLSAALRTLGLEDLANTVSDLGGAFQDFGDVFEQTSGGAAAAGYNDIAASIIGLGDALEVVTGLPVSDFFRGVADAVQVFGTSFATAQADGLDPFSAALVALGDTLEHITGLDVSGFFDTLGEKVQGGADALGSFLGAIRDGDWEAAGQIIQDFSDAALAGIQNLADTIGAQLQSIDLGEIAVNIAGWVQGKWDDLKSWLKSNVGIDVDAIDLASIAVNVLSWVQGTIADIGAFLNGLFTGSSTGGGPNSGAAAKGAAAHAIGVQVLVNVTGYISGAIASLSEFLANLLGGSSANSMGAPGERGEAGTASAGLDLGAITVNINEWVAGTLPDLSNFVSKITDWLHEHLAVSPEFVASAEQLGKDLGTALTTAIGEGFSAMTTGGGGDAIGGGTVGQGVLGTSAMDGISTSIGDAFKAFEDAFGLALDAGIDAAVAHINAALEAKKTEWWNNIQTGISNFFNMVGGVSGGPLPGPQAAAGHGSGAIGSFISERFSEFVTAFLDAVGTGIQEAIAKIRAGIEAKKTDLWNGIKEAFGNLFAGTLLSPIGVSGKEAETALDATQMGTDMGKQFGDVFASQEFADGLEAGMAEIPASAFSGVATGLLTKIGDSITASMGGQGQPGIGEGVGDSSTIGAGLGTSLVTSIATGLQTAIDSAPIETFAAIGTSLITKIQGAISAAMTTADTGGQQGPVSEGAVGGMGASLVSGLATSIAASITAAPIEAFAAIGTALQTKISEVLATAMQAGGGQATPQAGLGGTGGGGGIGQAIAQSIADAISGADFSAVATALETNLGTSVTTAIQQISTTISTATNVWITTFITTFTAIAQAALAGMAGVVTSVQTGLQAISERLSAYTNVWITTIITTVAAMQASLDGFAASAAAAGEAAGSGFSTGLAQGLSTALSTVTGVIANIIGVMNAAAGQAEAAGVAVGTGFANGISSTTGLAEAAGRAVAAAAIGSMNATIDSASPSKVTMGIGEMFGQGFQLGIMGAVDDAAAAGAAMGQSAGEQLYNNITPWVDQAKTLMSDWATWLQDQDKTTRDAIRLEKGQGNWNWMERLESRFGTDFGDDRAATLRNLLNDRGSDQGGGVIQTTGTVELDGEAMGTFTVETVLGGLVGAQRKGGKRRGRMQ